MEESPYDVFLRNIYCQFVTEGVPSRGFFLINKETI
jgi:hypothetical protein